MFAQGFVPAIGSTHVEYKRAIVFGDRVATQLRWDVFNAANHPIFGLPNSTLNSKTYGQVSSTNVDSREMQVSLRITF